MSRRVPNEIRSIFPLVIPVDIFSLRVSFYGGIILRKHLSTLTFSLLFFCILVYTFSKVHLSEEN
jgi:hypothetical protein